MSPLIPAFLLAACAAPALAQPSGDWSAGLDAGSVVGGIKQAAALAKTERIDLRYEFIDLAARDQDRIGDCHAFSSVALLEAAYFRRHGRPIRLSEEDLFLQNQVLSGKIFHGPCAKGKCEFFEGWYAADDARFALDHGVLQGSSYKVFVKRYEQYRNSQTKAMADMQSVADHQNAIQKLFYNPREHWKELQTRPEIQELLTRYLEGHDHDFAAERLRIKNELAGFSVRERPFRYYLGKIAMSAKPEDCRSMSGEQRAAILGELRAGRPVAVSFSLDGLKAWGSSSGSHAFLLVGARVENGRYVFESRNSWGGDNPDVPEDELCRVYMTTSVLVPGEE